MPLVVYYRFERGGPDLSGAEPIHTILQAGGVRRYAIVSLDVKLYTVGLAAQPDAALLTEISQKAREQGFEVSGPYDKFPRNF